VGLEAGALGLEAIDQIIVVAHVAPFVVDCGVAATGNAARPC
jgi:hypothetical protein